MSSAISFSSAFSSSSKGSFAAIWVVGSAVQSLLVAFAVTTTKIKTSTLATSTIQSVLAPSPCIPVAGGLGRPYMAAIAYIGVIGMIVTSIFFAKTSNGSSASPPDPPAPDPGSVNTASKSRESAPPPHTPTAAAGAPPPPPPGNNTTCGNERRPKRSFWLLRWLFAIVLWIVCLVVEVFKWVLIKTVWRPIAIVSSLVSFILLHGAVLPLLVQEFSHAYGVTPALKPYIPVPPLRWLALWGLAQCLCWIINVVAWVVFFVIGTAIWAVRFTWRTCRAICLSTIHWLWSRWRAFRGDVAWLALAVVFIPGVGFGIFFHPPVPLVVYHILRLRERVLVSLFVREGPDMIVQILLDSQFGQEVVFWGKCIGVPMLSFGAPMLLFVVRWLQLFPEDRMLVVGIALFSILIRWIFSSKRSERAARRKLEKRVKMLECRS
ncbi:hypothetical protein C8R45DRAFT_922385 [Mycena sanguinolenta]|nr:hypothetical protein C8R45DRAFT_922385 [Mycena sanguinolenta]